MDRQTWLKRLMEDELNHLALIDKLLREKPEVVFMDESGETALAAIERRGIDTLGAFHDAPDVMLKRMASWFKTQDAIVEAPYDLMVKLFAATEINRMPERFYRLMHDGAVSEESPVRLEFKRVPGVEGYEEPLTTGLQEIFGYKRREVRRLLDDPYFKAHLEQGVYMFEHGGKLVGFVIIRARTPHYAELSNLWVRKSLRGKGYSNEIVRIMVQLNRENGRRCLVTLSQQSHGMLRFFENEDFEMVRVLSREKLQ